MPYNILLEDSSELITEDSNNIVTEDYVAEGGVGNISITNNLSGDMPTTYIGTGELKVTAKRFQSDKRIKYE